MLMFHFRSTSLHVFSLLVEKIPEPALVYLHVSTRQHSSRMRTTRLPTVHVLVVTTRCQYQGGEYAFPAGPMSGGEGDCEYSPRGTHPTWVLPPLRNMRQWYSTPGKDMEPEIPTPCGQTDTCENITFPQLCWREAIRRTESHYKLENRSLLTALPFSLTSPAPMCPVWTKFVGRPIIVLSILLLFLWNMQTVCSDTILQKKNQSTVALLNSIANFQAEIWSSRQDGGILVR